MRLQLFWPHSFLLIKRLPSRNTGTVISRAVPVGTGTSRGSHPTYHIILLLSLHLSQIILIRELAHHVGNAVLDVAEHATEVDLKGTVLAMRLLDVVVGDEADLSKTDDAVFELIATLERLVVAESLLLQDQHLVHALVEGRTDVLLILAGWEDEVHPVLVLLRAIEAIDELLLSAEGGLGLQPHIKRLFVELPAGVGTRNHPEELLQTLIALLCGDTIDDVNEDGEEIVLSGIGLLEALGLVVAEANVHLLKGGTEMDCLGKVLVHLPDHTENIVLHGKLVVLVDVSELLDDVLGGGEVVVGGLASAELSESGVGHPLHRLLRHGGEAVLGPLDLANGHGEGRGLALVVDKVTGVSRVVGGGESLLKGHDRIARLLSGDLTDLTEHQVLDVGPLHTEVDHIALDVHASAAGTALHLLSNERGESVAHVTAEDAGTEGHVDTVGEGIVGEDDGDTAILGQHLHLTTVAGEANLIGVDGDTTPETTDKSMVDINLLAGLPHVGNDILNLVEIETLSGRRKDVLVVGLGGILGNERRVLESSLGLLLSFDGIDAVGLTGSNLTHSSLLPGKLDQIRPVIGELGNLLALQAGEKSLEHIERTIGVELESNGGKKLRLLQLRSNVVHDVAHILHGLERRGDLGQTEALIQVGVRLGEGSEAQLEAGLVLLGLVEGDTLALTKLGLEEVVGIVQLLEDGRRKDGLHADPQIDHVRRSHTEGGDELRLVLETLGRHGSDGLELDKLLLLAAILALGLGDDVTLQVDETSIVLLKDDFLVIGVNGGGLNMLVGNLLKPITKLGGIADGSTEGEAGAVAGLDDALEGVSLGTVEGMDLVENKVVELAVSTVEDHELLLSLGHFLTGDATGLGNAAFEGKRSADVHLSITGDFLEGNLIRADGNVATEKLVVRGGNLPHEDLAGQDEENGSLGALTGVSTEQGLTGGGGSANDGRGTVVNGLQDAALPRLELELAVVPGQRGETVGHVGELEGDEIVLAAHELAGILERILEGTTRIGSLLEKRLERLGLGRQDDLLLLLLVLLILCVVVL